MCIVPMQMEPYRVRRTGGGKGNEEVVGLGGGSVG